MLKYPVWLKVFGGLFAMSLMVATSSVAVMVTLEPSQDNTLYEDANGSLSNGAGSFLFAGQTASGPGSLRRGLIQFDIASAIPPGSIINSVQLQLVSSTPNPRNGIVSLHRVLGPWGEGNSQGDRGEGAGGVATPGDATWLHSFFDTTLWALPGGDFEAVGSASLEVMGNATQIWESTPELVADVQRWSDFPSSNFGWLLELPNATSASALRFNSRESSDPTQAPQLLVDFTPPPVSITPRSGTFVTAQGVDIVLLVQAPAETITNRTIFLNGMDVSSTFGPCFDRIPGTLVDGGQTFRCTAPEAATAFAVGTQTFRVVLDHMDGSTSEDSVRWVVRENTEP